MNSITKNIPSTLKSALLLSDTLGVELEFLSPDAYNSISDEGLEEGVHIKGDNIECLIKAIFEARSDGFGMVFVYSDGRF